MFLWRGSVQIPLPKFPFMKTRKSGCADETTPLRSDSPSSPENRYITVWAPVNSIIGFIWGILLVENSILFPSFLLFCIPWMLFGVLSKQSRHPSPWHRPRVSQSIRERYLHFFYSLGLRICSVLTYKCLNIFQINCNLFSLSWRFFVRLLV